MSSVCRTGSDVLSYMNRHRHRILPKERASQLDKRVRDKISRLLAGNYTTNCRLLIMRLHEGVNREIKVSTLSPGRHMFGHLFWLAHQRNQARHMPRLEVCRSFVAERRACGWRETKSLIRRPTPVAYYANQAMCSLLSLYTQNRNYKAGVNQRWPVKTYFYSFGVRKLVLAT